MSDEPYGLTAPAPPGPSQDVRYRQGTILTFDQITLENTVDVGGTIVANLPLLGVAEASSLVIGANVGLMVIVSDKGTTTYAILGRMVTPGTQAATDSVNQLNDRMFAADLLTGTIGSSSSTSYGPLGGPVVNAHIGPSGRAVLMVGCGFSYGASDAAVGGEMTVEITGATTRGASTDYAARSHMALFGNNPASVTVDTTIDMRQCMVSIVHGLNPGEHTFTGSYRATAAGVPCTFADPVIVVFAL